MQIDRIATATFGAACIALALSFPAPPAGAQDTPPAAPAPSTAPNAPASASPPPVVGAEKAVSGMSIVGNDEAPKALVIVPWKTSDLGDTLDVSRLVDDGRNPVDREVFRRAIDYYEIRTGNEE